MKYCQASARPVNTCFNNHPSPFFSLLQVEYAIEAIKLGSTAIGIQTSEGVVLAVEKRVTSPLMEPTTLEKIVEIDKHIGSWRAELGIWGDIGSWRAEL